MQGAEDQMAGHRRFHGQGNGFQITHLADHDDIRVFAQGSTQGRGKAVGMCADFPVVDDTFLAVMDKFDGILNGQNMIFADFIAFIDNRPPRVVDLPEPVGPVTSTSPLGRCARRGYNRRQTKLFNGHYLAGDFPENGTDAVFLLEIIAAIPGKPGNFITEINIAGFLESV